ncbi:MAG: M23 family metallopeptidase, partial [Ruminococcaceae bacterium]|nr:M23 family metallopeptidase [Oscillospiraceae bacterium]
VRAGDKLGVMGNTGYSFGAHLHFEVRNGSKKINPEDILGIPNKVGTYTAKSEYEEDIEVLAKKGIINTPSYWLKREDIDPHFASLIHKVAEKIG